MEIPTQSPQSPGQLTETLQTHITEQALDKRFRRIQVGVEKNQVLIFLVFSYQLVRDFVFGCPTYRH